jgi:hypothetical protein
MNASIRYRSLIRRRRIQFNQALKLTRTFTRQSGHFDLTRRRVRTGRAKAPRKVYRYSAEFKVKAVKLSQLEGVEVQDVAEALLLTLRAG